MRRIFVYEYFSGGGPVARADGTATAPGGDGDVALLEAGVAMRDAIVDDLSRLADVRVTWASGDPGDRAARGTTGPLSTLAAPVPGEPPEAFVRRMAGRHDLSWVVAPETGGVLARLRDAVGDRGWLGCRADAIRLASSKPATLAWLAARGIATPLAFAAGHIARRGRWIVKPVDGAGTTATRVHADHQAARRDLDQRRAAGRAATLEPFVDGDALSISLVAGADLARIVAINRQRIAIDERGWLHDRGVQGGAIDLRGDPRAGALRSLALDAAAAMPGLGGFVGIDVVWNEERGPVLIEVNPRVTSAYVGLSRRTGRNLALDVMEHPAMPEVLDAAS
jgi:predicted ATP-grasp superfamily ATP-dependent carboligase